MNACTTTHGTIPSERDPDTSWVTPTHQAIEKTPTSKCVGKTDTHFRHHPDLSTGLYNQEWTSNSQVLTEKKRVWTVHLAFQLLRLPFKYWVHSTPSSENQWACISEFHGTAENKVCVLNRCTRACCGFSQGSAQRGQAKVPTSQRFPGRSSTAYITRCSWGQLLISMHLSTDCSTPCSLGNQCVFPPPSSDFLQNKTKLPVSPWKDTTVRQGHYKKSN